MTALLVLHLAAALVAPLLVRWWGRQAFLVLARKIKGGLKPVGRQRFKPPATLPHVEDGWILQLLPSLRLAMVRVLDPDALVLAAPSIELYGKEAGRVC